MSISTNSGDVFLDPSTRMTHSAIEGLGQLSTVRKDMNEDKRNNIIFTYLLKRTIEEIECEHSSPIIYTMIRSSPRYGVNGIVDNN